MVHLFAKVGFAANDASTSLKLVEKGFKREDLAIMVLIDFPFQIVGGWLAAKWSRGERPLRPWIFAFLPRFAFAFAAALVVYYFPKQPIPLAFFVLMVVHTVLSSFASYVVLSSLRFLAVYLKGFCRTVQFVGISAFHTRVSDPVIGGTYMTVGKLSCLLHISPSLQLLATFTNLGGTWPKWFVLKGNTYNILGRQQLTENTRH